MKHLVLLLTCTFSLTCFAASNLEGRDAPGFSLPTREGKPVELKEFRGKVVYLDFWASWCGPCRKSFGWMNEVQAKYAAQGLQIIGVNLDEKTEDAARFLKETPAKFTLLFDQGGKLPTAYGVKGMPTSYLIGRDGKVIAEHVGFKDADRADLEKRIQAALEGN
jgi:peroxiredoxin